MQTARISSFQSLGAVDGPGLRCVVFLQGCPLRCAYCHNPETWDISGGEEVTLSALLQKIERYRPYILKNGGVTVSGGEPLLQAAFVTAFFRALQARGYHTTLDTSGFGDLAAARDLLAHCDLVLLDLKFTDPAIFRQHCKGDLSKVHDFLALTTQLQTPVRLRQVIVPGLNDTKEQVQALKAVAALHPNVQGLELLPFRSLCEPKYESMGLPFPFAGVPDCPAETIAELKTYL